MTIKFNNLLDRTDWGHFTNKASPTPLGCIRLHKLLHSVASIEQICIGVDAIPTIRQREHFAAGSGIIISLCRADI
jgi:hypothetical protein